MPQHIDKLTIVIVFFLFLFLLFCRTTSVCCWGCCSCLQLLQQFLVAKLLNENKTIYNKNKKKNKTKRKKFITMTTYKTNQTVTTTKTIATATFPYVPFMFNIW